jgi:hypothetical protein
MKRKIMQLDEKSMLRLEEQIPELARQALKRAYVEALASGNKVLEAINGMLVETSPDGSMRVIRSLPPPTRVVLGSKRVRRKSC